MDDEALDAHKEAPSKKRRVYASMREGGTKEQKEFSAVSDLLASMHDAGDMRFANLRMAADDPPDCTVETSEGKVIAVEITEFVSTDRYLKRGLGPELKEDERGSGSRAPTGSCRRSSTMRAPTPTS